MVASKIHPRSPQKRFTPGVFQAETYWAMALFTERSYHVRPRYRAAALVLGGLADEDVR